VTSKYGGHADQLSTQFVAMDYWRLKSLINLLNVVKNQSQREMIILEIQKKAPILLKGYQKHQNTQRFEEVSMMVKDFLI
jgi:hypothetical protein